MGRILETRWIGHVTVVLLLMNGKHKKISYQYDQQHQEHQGLAQNQSV